MISVDVDVLTDIVNHHLQDFVSFRDEIVAFVEKSDEQTDEEPDAPADADTQG